MMVTHQKTALITGAAGGIGRVVAVALSQNGYSVTLAGRRQAALQQVIEDTRLDPERALAVSADITDPASVAALFRAHANRFGRLDLLFNNAGVGAPGVPLEDVSFEQWRAVIDTNVTGAFLCTQEAFRLMKAQQPRGGRIINNGSVAAQAPRPFSTPYTSSKHAMTGLTRSAALDGRAYDIACGQIDIGNARTEMAVPQAQGVMQADGSIAAEPLIDLEHIADAVLYMAGLPLAANVLFMTVMATKMPLVGRG